MQLAQVDPQMFDTYTAAVEPLNWDQEADSQKGPVSYRLVV